MAASFQRARKYRDKQEQGVVLPPLPEKPENVRFGIVFLYAASAVALVFLIITGDVQWQEAGTCRIRCRGLCLFPGPCRKPSSVPAHGHCSSGVFSPEVLARLV